MHHSCRHIASKIASIHESGNKIDNEFLSNYINYINCNNQYYYEKCVCRKEIYVPILKQIFEYLDPNVHDLCNLTSFPVSISNPEEDPITDLFKQLINKKVNFTEYVLEAALLNKNIYISFLLLDIVKPTSACLEAACLCDNSLQLVNLMLVQKVKVSEKALLNAISINSNNVVNLFFDYGVMPTLNCLIEACKQFNYSLINSILNHKIIPNKDCFMALLSNAKIGDGKNKQYYKAKEIAEIIDMLIVYGYKVTYNDVYDALCVGCYINNVSNLGIKFEDEFIEQCTYLNYYPYQELGLEPTQKCLYIECSRPNNVNNINKLIAKGLKPDIECIKHACNNRGNIKNLTLLIEGHNIAPNIDCIKEIAKYICNPTLSYLLEHYKPTRGKKK